MLGSLVQAQPQLPSRPPGLHGASVQYLAALRPRRRRHNHAHTAVPTALVGGGLRIAQSLLRQGKRSNAGIAVVGGLFVS